MSANKPMTMRSGYAERLIELAQKDEKVLFVSADSGGDERKWFVKNAPERMIETGIAEANCASVMGGLASEGFRPFTLNFAYLMGRMYNQIVQSVVEDNYPVSLGGYYAGIWGVGGRSHNCVIDLAIMKALPNLTIFTPADYWQTKLAVQKSYELKAPSYIRMSGITTPLVYDKEPEFKPMELLKNGADSLIFAHGTMVNEALEAAKLCSEVDGLDVGVVNIFMSKPLDTKQILKYTSRTDSVVIAEEHSGYGGIGEDVATILAVSSLATPVVRVAVPDQFPTSINVDNPNGYALYGLSKEDIQDAVKRCLWSDE